LIAWQLWKERNARTFHGVALQPSMVLLLIQLEEKLDYGWSQEPRSSRLRGVALIILSPPLSFFPLLGCSASCNIALRVGLASWHADGHSLP